MADRLLALLDAASPGPWHACAMPVVGRRTVEAAGSVVVESDLGEDYAAYLVSLRTVADGLVMMLRDPSRRDLDLARRVSEDFNIKARAVSARWLFVAPRARGGAWYMHNSAIMIGAGQLRAADAALIDVVPSAVPELLARLGLPSCHVSSEPDQTSCPPVIIPRRVPDDDIVAEYAGFAAPSNDIQALAGRYGLAERTQVMIEAIAQRLDVRPGQRILDIGCGDASLLARFASSAALAVGTVLTESERNRLAADPYLKDIVFRVASLEGLATVPGHFDWIIANGCLHFARTHAGARRALRNIAERLAPGGKVWAGELHVKDLRFRRTFGRLEAIRQVRAERGWAAASAFARHLWRRRQRSRHIVEASSQSSWHIAPEELPDFVARHGLRVDALWSCREMTGDSFYSLQDRYSCLLSR